MLVIEYINPGDPRQNGNLWVAEALSEMNRRGEVLKRLGNWDVD